MSGCNDAYLKLTFARIDHNSTSEETMARASHLAFFVAGLGVSATLQAGQSAVEWPTKLGGNGHWYEAVLVPEAITWLPASAAATARGGHLATPTSAAENDFILATVVPSLGSYIGFGPILGGSAGDGGCMRGMLSPACFWVTVQGDARV